MTSDDRVYLDHAATTPLHESVLEAMLPYLRKHWHNPSSIYVEAQAVRRAIDEARETVATAIGAIPDEIVFTSGGSEANVLALRGVLETRNTHTRHMVTSAAEHHSVLDTAEQIDRLDGTKVTVVGVDREGCVDPTAVVEAVHDDTVLVSVMHANNEVGTVNDIAQIAAAVHERAPHAVVHTDAVQSTAHLGLYPGGVDVKMLGVDLLTLTGHKLYGPRGAAALYVRAGTPLSPQILGGTQERRLRAGTEDTPAIVGLAAAIELAAERREADLAHERALQERLITELPQRVPMLAITGPHHLEKRLPGSVSCVVGFVEGESILLALDLAGIAASSGSACTTGSVEPSHVLLAMGIPPELARGSLRFTLGRDNDETDVERLLTTLPVIVERLRTLSPIPTTDLPAEWQPWFS